MRHVALIACFAIARPLMAACGSEESIPNSASTLVSPESSSQAQRTQADPDRDTAILEEGGNINLALWLAQSGMGPSIVGDPTAVYGGIMTYRAALEAVGSGARPGPSQAWMLDREAYVYLFEGEFTESMTGTEPVTDWAQKPVIFDAETGKSYTETTSRELARRAVSTYCPSGVGDPDCYPTLNGGVLMRGYINAPCEVGTTKRYVHLTIGRLTVNGVTYSSGLIGSARNVDCDG